MSEPFHGLTLQQGASGARSSSGKLLSLVPGTSVSPAARIQEQCFTGSPYLNLTTRESRTQRTKGKTSAFVDPGTCKVTEQWKKELLKAF